LLLRVRREVFVGQRCGQGADGAFEFWQVVIDVDRRMA